MPKKNESYSCLVCGQRYQSYEEAEKCEKSHKIPVHVEIYPETVLVHFADNSSARYKRC